MVFQVLCRSSHTTHSGISVQMVKCVETAEAFHHLPQTTQCCRRWRGKVQRPGPMPLLAQMAVPRAFRHRCGVRSFIHRPPIGTGATARKDGRHPTRWPGPDWTGHSPATQIARVHILRDQLITLTLERVPSIPLLHGIGERLPNLVSGIDVGVVSNRRTFLEGSIAKTHSGARGFEFLGDEFVEHVDGDVCVAVSHFVSFLVLAHSGQRLALWSMELTCHPSYSSRCRGPTSHLRHSRHER